MYHLIVSTESLQDHTTQWLTGRQPSHVVIIADAERRTFLLFVDARYTGLQLSSRSGRTGEVLQLQSGRDFLQTYGQKFSISDQLSRATHHQIASYGYDLTVQSGYWEQLRVVKSSEELHIMKICYSNTLQVLEYLHAMIDDSSIIGKSCLTVRGECIAYAMSLGLSGEAFEMIVATGAQTSSPHHQTDEMIIGHGPLLIDMGWKWQGYCSDLTRSWWIGEQSGESYEIRSRIYQIVQSAHTTCVSQSLSGMTGQQIDAIARGVIERAGYADQFTHSTGHGIGLQVHELPWITKSERGNMPLKEGMCLTIEPGVYVSGQMGVRIEDSYVMATDGLTRLDQYGLSDL